jgi:hypothetical protein
MICKDKDKVFFSGETPSFLGFFPPKRSNAREDLVNRSPLLLEALVARMRPEKDRKDYTFRFSQDQIFYTMEN